MRITNDGISLTNLQEVDFPSADESVGQVFVGWRGPVARDVDTRTALGLLWSYLSETPVSPLQAAMIEVPDPYCASLGLFSLSYSVTANILAFSGVPTEKLPSVIPKYVSAVILRVFVCML